MFRFFYLHSPVFVRRRIERNRLLFKLIDHKSHRAKIDRKNVMRQEVPEPATAISETLGSTESLVIKPIRKDENS